MKYKTINIPIDEYEKIKIFCDKNALKITKWISKVVLEKIRSENERKK